MSEFNYRIVAVMNKSVDPGKAMNALAHIVLGLGAQLNGESVHLVDYRDADGNIYGNISKMPFVILEANSNKIRNLREQANANHIQQVSFTDAMTVGTWQEQLSRSEQTKADDLVFYGIVLFGDAQKVTELTKKFSLWK